jgi:hypothetical protein
MIRGAFTMHRIRGINFDGYFGLASHRRFVLSVLVGEVSYSIARPG